MASLEPVYGIDIPAGGRGFCEILQWDPTTTRPRLAIDPQRKVLFPVEGGPYGEQRVAVSVSCANAEATRVVVGGMLREGQPVVDANNIVRRSPIYNVQVTDQPNPSEVLHEGLLGLWTQRHQGTEVD